LITDRLHAHDVTADDILALIAARQYELNELEFKESADADLIKSACGIANAGGGFILIGIAEDKDHRASSIVHIPDSNGVADSVRQRIRDGLTPRPVIEVLPLTADGKDIVIVRVAPQNSPHMVSVEKRTDFYGRYDATTEKMRYEEIEQRFREKDESGHTSFPETLRVVIETIGGRTSISAGANSALEEYRSRLQASQTPTLALIAVSDGNSGAIAEPDAVSILFEPLYARKGGWQVAHDRLEVTHESGLWVQHYGEVSTTTVNPSGDIIFLKPVDDVLCWRQNEADFKNAPRIYPNSLIEYCLSFAFLVADAATRTHPKQFFVEAVISNANGVRLPLGEGGSVWFDTPIVPPQALKSAFERSLTIVADTSNGKPVWPRRLAFQIASQIYSFFAYREDQVAFSADAEITFEDAPDTSTLTALRSYLQNVLGKPLSRPHQNFDTAVHWFRTEYLGKPYRIGASEEFVSDHHWSEARLFSLLDAYKLPQCVQDYAPDNYLVLTSAHGPMKIPRK
jgi:hypothetical protein